MTIKSCSAINNININNKNDKNNLRVIPTLNKKNISYHTSRGGQTDMSIL